MTLIDDLCDGCGSRFDPMGDPVLTKHPEIGPYAVYCATCEHKAKMTDATELDEAAVRARLEAATEGPWEVDRTLHGPTVIDGLDGSMIFVETYGITWTPNPADAEFIAHARTDLPAALDEITRLRAALDEAGAEVEWRSRHIEIGAEQLTAMKARAEAAEERAFAEHQRALVAGYEQAQDDLEELVRERDEARAERDSWKVAAERREQRAVAAENAQWAAESALAAVQALVGSVGPRSATAGSPYSTGRWDAFAEVRAALDGETEDGVFGDPDIHARLTRAALATPTTPTPSDGDAVTTEGDPR